MSALTEEQMAALRLSLRALEKELGSLQQESAPGEADALQARTVSPRWLVTGPPPPT